MAGKPLHDNEILEVIERHWLDKLYPPSIQYLVENSGIASKSTARGALRRLSDKGLIQLVYTPSGYKVYTNWAYRVLYDYKIKKDEFEMESP